MNYKKYKTSNQIDFATDLKWYKDKNCYSILFGLGIQKKILKLALGI